MAVNVLKQTPQSLKKKNGRDIITRENIFPDYVFSLHSFLDTPKQNIPWKKLVYMTRTSSWQSIIKETIWKLNYI